MTAQRDPSQKPALSEDAKAIIDALDSDWIGRGFHLGIGLTICSAMVAAIIWVLWTLYGAASY
jgi:hypothetical protein